jgi:hypothetical protein
MMAGTAWPVRGVAHQAGNLHSTGNESRLIAIGLRASLRMPTPQRSAVTIGQRNRPGRGAASGLMTSLEGGEQYPAGFRSIRCVFTEGAERRLHGRHASAHQTTR